MSLTQKWSALFAGILVTSPTAASAYDPIVLKHGWERVDFTSGDGCEAEIGSNGQYYIIAIYGMRPGESGRFYLANENMRPINRKIRADQAGVWSEYYIPALWGHKSGTVNINIASQSCELNMAFEWKRNSVKVHG